MQEVGHNEQLALTQNEPLEEQAKGTAKSFDRILSTTVAAKGKLEFDAQDTEPISSLLLLTLKANPYEDEFSPCKFGNLMPNCDEMLIAYGARKLMFTVPD